MKSAPSTASKFPRYDRYKDSGVEWLGEVPEHWEVKPFQALFEMSGEKNGKEIIGEMLSISGFRGVETKRYESESQKRTAEQLADYRVVRRGQLAVNTMWLNYAGLGVSDLEGHMSPAYRAYNISAELDGRFAHHLLRSSLYVEGYTGLMQGIRPNSLQIKNEDFKKIPVLLPPKPEQDRIVAFLDEKTAQIDALIAKKERQILLLEEQKAIRINQAVTRGLNPGVKLKASGVAEIGEIPEAWNVSRIRHAFRVIDCKHLTVPFNDGGFKLISIGELNGLHVDTSSANQTDERHFKHLSEGERQLRSGDLIFSRNASVGKCSIVEDPTECSMGQDVCLLRSQGLDAEFAIRVLRSPTFQKQIARLLVGSTFNRINISELKDLSIPIPPAGEIAKILGKIESIDTGFMKVLELTKCEIESLKTLRSALIAHAVTGKIKV